MEPTEEVRLFVSLASCAVVASIGSVTLLASRRTLSSSSLLSPASHLNHTHHSPPAVRVHIYLFIISSTTHRHLFSLFPVDSQM